MFLGRHIAYTYPGQAHPSHHECMCNYQQMDPCLPDCCRPRQCECEMEHHEHHCEHEMEHHKPTVYVVRKGDTVYQIAQRFGINWHVLANYNHLCNPALIFPGQVLKIPQY